MVIRKTPLLKYIENFTTKNWMYSDKNSELFHISAQNMDWGVVTSKRNLRFWTEKKK